MTRKTRLTEAEQVKVTAILKRDSSPKVAKRWDLADEALLRAANGYAIQRGTRALIELGLKAEEVADGKG